MTLAGETREAARAQPFIHDALQAGVLNYTAAARHLDVGGDVEAVATALRRYAASLEDDSPETSGVDPSPADGERQRRSVNVTMQRGTDVSEVDEDAILNVGGVGLAPGEGSLTAILATGTVDAGCLERVLGRLRIAEITVKAAGLADESLAVAVPDRDGANAVRLLEEALS